MKINQQILGLDPRLSRLLDSLCFQLAVSVPDESSLSLLEIIQMSKTKEITYEELQELYVSWLQAKNVFSIFNTKQTKIYSKNELISNKLMATHIDLSSVNSSLELLQKLYNSLYESNSSQRASPKLLKAIDELFEYLDTNGNRHLRLSQLFFLVVAICINQKIEIPSNYQSFKQILQDKNRQFCAVEGMVSKRWFRNYFLFSANDQSLARNLLIILQEMQKELRIFEQKKIRKQRGLPNIIEMVLFRARELAFGTDYSQIYLSMFEQNQQIVFFNGGKTDRNLNQSYFVQKYGQELIKSIQINDSLLKQLNFIVKFIINDYLQIFNRVAQGQNQKKYRSSSSYIMNASIPIVQKTQKTPIPSLNIQSMKFIGGHKKNSSFGEPDSPSFKKLQIKQSNGSKTARNKEKGNLTSRTNRPSTQVNIDSPFLRRTGQKKKEVFVAQTQNDDDFRSLYTRTIVPVFKNAEKKGLQKNSCYQKLSFFRNKRVESFDIVIKRLKEI